MNDCIFCKIVKGEVPCFKIYETDDVLAFLDIKPLTKGHSLVIPKNHSENIFDISEEDLKKVALTGKKIAEILTKKLKADGIRLSQSSGRAAGQDVMHFHLHVIPRYLDDGIAGGHPAATVKLPEANMEELKKLAEEINK